MEHTRRNQSGIALLLALFAVFVVTSIGLGMLFLSDSETTVDSNYRDEQTVYYAARAGLEEARDRMNSTTGATFSTSLPTAKPGAANGVLYILNPTGSETVAPWTTTNAYFDDEICKEVSCGSGQTPPTSGWYVSPALTASSAYAPTGTVLPYKWMRITLKTDQSAAGSSNVMYVDGNSSNAAYYVCWNGTNEVTQSGTCSSTSLKPVYVVTTLAVTTSGSRRMLQYEVAQDQINLILPGALTIDGPIAIGAAGICGSGDTCSNSGDYISGNEASTCTTSTTTVPAIATADATSNSNLVTAINSNKANIVGSGGSPSVVSASSSLSSLNTPAEIEALVSKMETLAGSNVGSDCSKLNLGTAAAPTITVVTNAGGSTCDLNSGTTGYGILVLTGDLQLVNVNTYQGVIMMLGTATFTETSSKDTTIPGALFMAKDRCDASGDAPGPCTAAGQLMTGLGSPTFNFHHGNASSTDPSVQYNQCLINQVETSSNYKTIALHELLY